MINTIEDLELVFKFANLPNTPLKIKIEREYSSNKITADEFLAAVKEYLGQLKNNMEAKNDK
jgi:hypothetical protein